MEVGSLLGKVGLPAPIAELAARDWDAVVIGGGHNGLTAAAYLARAGQSVLVLERRERLGGACTLEQPFSDERFLVSPCAYVVGLLDQLVIDELDLPAHGYRVTPADPNLWCPFSDGTSFAQFLDDARHRGAHARQRLQRGRHSRRTRLRGDLRPDPPPASRRPRGRPLARTVAKPRADRGDPRRRRADLDRLRGADRGHPRPLRVRRAPGPRPVRAGDHRRVGRAEGRGHRVGPPDARHGGGGGPRRLLGLRRRRHGAGLLRDLRRGAGGGCRDRRGRAGREDRPGGGSGARVGRVDPGPHGHQQRRSEAGARDAPRAMHCPPAIASASIPGRCARLW